MKYPINTYNYQMTIKNKIIYVEMERLEQDASTRGDFALRRMFRKAWKHFLIVTSGRRTAPSA
jgi:hypothetical protein